MSGIPLDLDVISREPDIFGLCCQHARNKQQGGAVLRPKCEAVSVVVLRGAVLSACPIAHEYSARIAAISIFLPS